MAGCVSSTQNASTSAPAEIDGTWKGSFNVPVESRIIISFEFKKNGDTLTGAFLWKDKRWPITNGRIEGNKITFRTLITNNGLTVKSSYEGTVYSNYIRMKCQFMSAEGGGKVDGKFRRVN